MSATNVDPLGPVVRIYPGTARAVIDLAEPNRVVAVGNEMLIQCDDILPALPPVSDVKSPLARVLWIEPHHERNPGGTTYSLVTVSAVKTKTGGGECIDVRRDSTGTVNTKLRAKIIDGDE